jgi:hypothetical protein
MNWYEPTFRHLEESLAWNEDCFKAFVKMLAGSISNLSTAAGVHRKPHPAFRQLARWSQWACSSPCGAVSRACKPFS